MELICVKEFTVNIKGGQMPSRSPQLNEIVIVTSSFFYKEKTWLYLEGFEFDSAFCLDNFADITNLSKEIEESLKSVTPKRKQFINKIFDGYKIKLSDYHLLDAFEYYVTPIEK